jgi:hypothetical protein
MLAALSLSMNLDRQLMRPLVSMFSPLTPSPFDGPMRPLNEPLEPTLTGEDALALARAEASRRGIRAPAGGGFYSGSFGVYGVGFFEPGLDHGARVMAGLLAAALKESVCRWPRR